MLGGGGAQEALGEFQRGKLEIERENAEAKTSLSTNAAPTKVNALKPTASAPPTPAPISKVDREKLLRVAKELGVETEGRTDEDIRAEVSKALS